MNTTHRYHFIFTISLLASLTTSAQARAEPQTVTSCLSLHNVNNFTVFPISTNNASDNMNYYKLLNFSIQNLRFIEPAVPKPMIIILPETADQLASAVTCCREALWEFRVRCGGHSYEGSSYVSTNGAPFVIIDMMNLNRVRVDVPSETAWVEGGATLGETYYAISQSSEAHGFTAGSCPTVGVGGHIGGGGFGLLSRRYGLAADNVMDALLMDARGRLLDRQAMGEDVFWAVRGGGGGVWGVVFAWKIKLVRVPETVTSFIVSRPGTKRAVTKLIHKWQHAAPLLDREFYLSAFVGAGLPEMKGKIGISATFKGFYLGSANETVTILNKVFPELKIEAGRDCRESNWIESVLFFSGLVDTSSTSVLTNRYSAPQDRHYFKAKADYVKTLMPISGVRMAIDVLEKEPKGYVILDPYGGVMEEISGEAIAFPHRRGNLYTIQYLVEWREEDQHGDRGKECLDWIRGFYDSMTPYVSSDPRAAYVNYMDLDLGTMDDRQLIRYQGDDDYDDDDPVEIARVWGEKYFGKNYDRLVKAKTIIDPDNVFNNQQGIPPMPSISSKAKSSK